MRQEFKADGEKCYTSVQNNTTKMFPSNFGFLIIVISRKYCSAVFMRDYTITGYTASNKSPKFGENPVGVFAVYFCNIFLW